MYVDATHCLQNAQFCVSLLASPDTLSISAGDLPSIVGLCVCKGCSNCNGTDPTRSDSFSISACTGCSHRLLLMCLSSPAHLVKTLLHPEHIGMSPLACTSFLNMAVVCTIRPCLSDSRTLKAFCVGNDCPHVSHEKALASEASGTSCRIPCLLAAVSSRTVCSQLSL